MATAVVGFEQTNLFTVPAGETWLVKRVCSYNVGAPATQISWAIFNPGATSGHTLYKPTVGSTSADDHETWWALDAGCTLACFTTITGTFTCSAFGAKLLGLA